MRKEWTPVKLLSVTQVMVDHSNINKNVHVYLHFRVFPELLVAR